MLRKTVFGLVALIVLLQFPGFPNDITRWISLAAGLVIAFLLTWSQRGNRARSVTASNPVADRSFTAGAGQAPRVLEIVHKETKGPSNVREEKGPQ